MPKNYSTVKVTPDSLIFLKKITTNRLRVRLDEDEPITLTETITLIEKYFKNNNISYKEMISQEILQK